jgi:hypothetical protein
MDNKLNAVILDGYTENPGDLNWDYLESVFNLTVYDRTPKELVIERSKNADVLIVNKVAITRDILNELPKLKFVATLATGFNQLDTVATIGSVSANEINIPPSAIHMASDTNNAKIPTATENAIDGINSTIGISALLLLVCTALKNPIPLFISMGAYTFFEGSRPPAYIFSATEPRPTFLTSVNLGLLSVVSKSSSSKKNSKQFFSAPKS